MCNNYEISPQATFEKLENELREVNMNAESLKRNFLELTEVKHILRKTQVFFDEVCSEIIFSRLFVACAVPSIFMLIVLDLIWRCLSLIWNLHEHLPVWRISLKCLPVSYKSLFVNHHFSFSMWKKHILQYYSLNLWSNWSIYLGIPWILDVQLWCTIMRIPSIASIINQV